MLPSALARINALPEEALVLDVGAWGAPLHRADHVLDVRPYATRGVLGSFGPGPERFSEQTWHLADICDRAPWPFADDTFDFAVCVTTLEDVRDPIGVCRELSRVARAGYVEVPTVEAELIYNVEGTGPFLGHEHHRWFCDSREVTRRGTAPSPTRPTWSTRTGAAGAAALARADDAGGSPARRLLGGRAGRRASTSSWGPDLDALAARVRARFAPSATELKVKAARESARHVAARAILPVREAAGRALERVGRRSPEPAARPVRPRAPCAP